MIKKHNTKTQTHTHTHTLTHTHTHTDIQSTGSSFPRIQDTCKNSLQPHESFFESKFSLLLTGFPKTALLNMIEKWKHA